MPHSTNQFSVLKPCTLEITSDMLHPFPILGQPEIKPAMPENKPTIPTSEGQPPPHIYVHSTDTCQYIRVPLKVQSVDTGCPLAIDALLDSGTTEMFIDIEFVQAKRLKTHCLPHAIPVYNIDGTPNEAGTIKEEVDLICAYRNHTERATFSVTSLGHLAIILGHTWLTEHNPEVDWCSGE